MSQRDGKTFAIVTVATLLTVGLAFAALWDPGVRPPRRRPRTRRERRRALIRMSQGA